MRVVVLASGRGTNLKALLEAVSSGACAAEIVGVVSDRPKARALEMAMAVGVPTRVVPRTAHDEREQWDELLAEEVSRLQPELVVLAGFMRILRGPILDRFPARIINVHPSLLPAFRGADAPAQAVRAGVRISGCSVHVVDAGVDTGPIIAQAAIPVDPTDDAESLHRRIQAEEHRLLPQVVDWIARGHVVLDGGPRIVAPVSTGGRALVAPAFRVGNP